MRKIAAFLLALLLLPDPVPLPTLPPAQLEESPAPTAPVSLPRKKASVKGAEAVMVTMDDVLIAKGWRRGDSCFVPVRALCDFFGQELRWSGDREKFSLHIDALSVYGVRGQAYYTADGRYIWAPEGWLIREGELYLPCGALQKLFNLDAAAGKGGAVAFSSANMQLLEGGLDYYDLNFSTENIYWLTHIINAEARSEPLEGQIGVGNVVMNRVESERFPDTVYEVVYDTEHTIQFEPVALGGIRDDPSEQAVTAAYLVLEGANTVGDSLYFVNPDYGSAWFDAALELTVAIGHHNFYREKQNDAKQGD